MTNISAGITAVHGYLPEQILTNSDLEKMVETNDEWIRSRTGISERRILTGEGRGTSEMGEHAVRGLLEKSGLKPNDVDLLICATVTGDYIFPDTANIVRDRLGITNGWGFDVNAACSGFLYALHIGRQFIENGSLKNVIVLGADKMSSIVDYTDRTTCILFGDGAGAVLLQPKEDGTGILDSEIRSDGAGAEFLFQKAGGSKYPATAETVANREHFAQQDGRTVFKAAVGGMVSAVQTVMKRNDLTNESLSWLVPHQANLRIISTVASMADIPMEKVMVTIEKYGNTTAATLPLCLWQYEEQLKKNDKIILTAFGGGYTWGATYLKWS